MLRENQDEFITKAKERYWKIGSVSCPAFGEEKIHFDEHGLRHLMWKDGTPRNISDQVRRFHLLKYVSPLLETSREFVHYRVSERKHGPQVSHAHFWTFAQPIRNKMITVVIRQIGDGRKHFFSIMDKKLPKSAQTP